MIQEKHLQVFELTLETKSPVFIGNGKSAGKKDYLFEPERHLVSFIDEPSFFTYLVRHHLVDAYEAFMLGNTNTDLLTFLKQSGVSEADISSFVRYRVDAADALDEYHTLKEISRFVRSAAGEVYVPGSSVKGAIRTALLKAMLLHSPPASPDRSLLFDKRATFEETYFHTLSLKKSRDRRSGDMVVDRRNPLNSILRGVRISDSLPVPDSMLCITGKIDVFADGHRHAIHVCRECIRPGVTVRCTVTLDQSILQGKLTAEDIRQAIAAASQYYQDSVISHYPQAHNYMNAKTILLGGGVGFQSKTVTAPYYGKEALRITSDILNRSFCKHHHDRDAAEGLSPRALKQTNFQHTAYPYGVCEVTIR